MFENGVTEYRRGDVGRLRLLPDSANRRDRQGVDRSDLGVGGRYEFYGPHEISSFQTDVEWRCIENGHFAEHLVVNVDKSWTTDHEAGAGVVKGCHLGGVRLSRSVELGCDHRGGLGR